MRPILYLLIFCIFPASGVFAATVSSYGIVRDDETLLPLGGVLVKSTGTGETQVTDSTGRFLLTTVAVRYDRRLPPRYTVIRWDSRAALLDISDAPGVTTLELFSIGGRQRALFQPKPGQRFIALPRLPSGMYLLTATFPSGEYTMKLLSAPGVHSGGIHLPGGQGSRTASQPITSDTLVLGKDFYRTKKTAYRIDSIYQDFTVHLKPSIGDYLFLDTVRTYRLTIADADINTLNDYYTLSPGPGNTNPVYVPAHLSVENRSLDSIAVRYRGDQSLWDCITNGSRNVLRYPQFGFGNDDVCAKFSFKFNFKKYRDDQRLYGLKKLNFRSMSYDPTKMHERLAFSFFHDMNIVAPRTAYARLYVNNTYWGIFCVVEEIDGRFTKQRFPESGDGNLYKDLWPDSLTADGDVLDALQTNEETGAVDDFISFRDAVTATSTTDSTFIPVVGGYVDLPYCIRYMVVDRAIMNFDGIVSVYTGTGWRMRHNFCWYRDLPTSKFILIPWDLDKVFLYPEPNFWTNNQPVGNNTVPNWNVVTNDRTPIGCYFDPSTIAMNRLGAGPYYDVLPIDADKFLRLFRNTTWEEFVTAGRTFLDEVFLQDTVDARLTGWRRQIAAAVGEDPTIDSTAWEAMVDSLSHTIPRIRNNFELMLDSLIVLE